MKINLTDQELNDWLAVNVMGWVMTKLYPKEDRIWHDFSESPFRQFTCWNPSKDLNHTRLMEEKIRKKATEEIGDKIIYEDSCWDKYASKLFQNFHTLDLYDPKECKEVLEYRRICAFFEGLHASARQRCEAAYLAFNENKI